MLRVLPPQGLGGQGPIKKILKIEKHAGQFGVMFHR
jgi:hypothetical protein